ncbi:hypothetical protein ACUSIJ_14890 [Pseudochelatococcus sp. B33]
MAINELIAEIIPVHSPSEDVLAVVSQELGMRPVLGLYGDKQAAFGLMSRESMSGTEFMATSKL